MYEYLNTEQYFCHIIYILAYFSIFLFLTETMERLLVNWIENCNKQEVSVDMNMIMAKARYFYQKIRNKQEFSDMTQTELKESFNASKGWFNNFKKRTGISLQRPLDDQSGTISKQTWTAKKS